MITIQDRSFKFDNLTKRERQTLNNLAKRTDTVIKKNDKGDKIVVKQLDNVHRISKDINPDLTISITKFVQQAYQKGYINKDIYNFLIEVKEPHTPSIYLAVKPIVSNTNSPTCQLSAFINILLKPMVDEHGQILKNTTQLINEIETLVCPENITLVTADVVSLYPSIHTYRGFN